MRKAGAGSGALSLASCVAQLPPPPALPENARLQVRVSLIQSFDMFGSPRFPYPPSPVPPPLHPPRSTSRPGAWRPPWATCEGSGARSSSPTSRSTTWALPTRSRTHSTGCASRTRRAPRHAPRGRPACCGAAQCAAAFAPSGLRLFPLCDPAWPCVCVGVWVCLSSCGWPRVSGGGGCAAGPAAAGAQMRASAHPPAPSPCAQIFYRVQPDPTLACIKEGLTELLVRLPWWCCVACILCCGGQAWEAPTWTLPHRRWHDLPGSRANQRPAVPLPLPPGLPA